MLAISCYSESKLNWRVTESGSRILRWTCHSSPRSTRSTTQPASKIIRHSWCFPRFRSTIMSNVRGSARSNFVFWNTPSLIFACLSPRVTLLTPHTNPQKLWILDKLSQVTMSWSNQSYSSILASANSFHLLRPSNLINTHQPEVGRRRLRIAEHHEAKDIARKNGSPSGGSFLESSFSRNVVMFLDV